MSDDTAELSKDVQIMLRIIHRIYLIISSLQSLKGLMKANSLELLPQVYLGCFFKRLSSM